MEARISAGGDGAARVARILDLLRDERLRELVEWYFKARGANRVASRAQFEPTDFLRLIPHFFMYDFEPEARDFRLRLAGEEIRQLLPRAQRGMPLSQVMPTVESYTAVRDRYLRVVDRPAVMTAVGKVFLHVEGHGMGERLVVPLADKDGAVRQILGATVYWFGNDIPARQRRFAGEDVEVTYFAL